MRQGTPHTPEWFAKFRKERPICLMCPNRVKKPVNKLCSISCSNYYKYQKPENHPSWRGGSKVGCNLLRNKLWQPLQKWRQLVLERDGHKCIKCGSTENLQADHIKPFCYFPELRLDVKNGRTLCVSCHRKTDTYGPKARRILTGGKGLSWSHNAHLEKFWEEIISSVK